MKNGYSISKLTPKVDEIQNQGVANAITDLIIKQASNHLSTIMTKIIYVRWLKKINTFDLDYIERLIIEIANKELKLIMSLGFILGGIMDFPRYSHNLCLTINNMLW